MTPDDRLADSDLDIIDASLCQEPERIVLVRHIKRLLGMVRHLRQHTKDLVVKHRAEVERLSVIIEGKNKCDL